jgi:hypothetical protein
LFLLVHFIHSCEIVLSDLQVTKFDFPVVGTFSMKMSSLLTMMMWIRLQWILSFYTWAIVIKHQFIIWVWPFLDEATVIKDYLKVAHVKFKVYWRFLLLIPFILGFNSIKNFNVKITNILVLSIWSIFLYKTSSMECFW